MIKEFVMSKKVFNSINFILLLCDLCLLIVYFVFSFMNIPINIDFFEKVLKFIAFGYVLLSSYILFRLLYK